MKAQERLKEIIRLINLPYKKNFENAMLLVHLNIEKQGILLGLESGKQEALLITGKVTAKQLTLIVKKAIIQGRREVFEEIEKLQGKIEGTYYHNGKKWTRQSFRMVSLKEILKLKSKMLKGEK